MAVPVCDDRLIVNEILVECMDVFQFRIYRINVHSSILGQGQNMNCAPVLAFRLGRARNLLPQALLFVGIFVAFFFIGMATANADEGDKPVSGSNVVRDGDDGGIADADAKPDSEPATEPEPKADTTPKPDAEPKPEADIDPGVTQAPTPDMAPEPEKSQPEQASNEGDTKTESPTGQGESAQPDAISETLENVNETLADKPERLTRTVARTVKNTADAVTSEDASDKTLEKLADAATDPLKREVSDTLNDTVALVQRETDVVERTVGDLTQQDVDKPGEDSGVGTPVGDEGTPLDGTRPTVPSASPEGDVVRTPAEKTSTTNMKSTVATTLTLPREDREVSVEGTATPKTSGADSAGAQSLDIGATFTSSSASAGSASGGSASPAICGTSPIILRPDAEWKTTTSYSPATPQKVSLQPGFAPD